MKRGARRALFVMGLPFGVVILTPLALWIMLPWPLLLRWRDPGTTAFMRARIVSAWVAGEDLEIQHAWVPLQQMSPVLARAVVVAEDDRFRQHRGVDWVAVAEEVRYDGEPPFSWFDADDRRALVRAVRYALDHRDEIRGRSTITQQLAKNLYFSPDRSFARKAAEVVVARRLERFLTKDRILELYLNTVELGPGVFGAEAASRYYFGVGASELGLWQAATLAATLPHPLTSNPKHRPGRMAWRRQVILGRM